MVKYMTLLGERLSEQGKEIELQIFGGSALALHYDTRRRTTDDIDALYVRDQVIEDEIKKIADEFGLQKEWLNDHIKNTLYGVNISADKMSLVLDKPGIKAYVVSAKMLLANKAMIYSRNKTEDIIDAAKLCKILNITNEQQIESVIKEFYPSSNFGSQELRFEMIIYEANKIR